MTAKDELAKLKREVEELKTKLSAPKSEPFVPEPYQRFDPTAGMSMPPSALAAMVADVPDHMVRDIAMRDGCAPTGPSAQGAIPSSQTITGVRPGGGSGWARLGIELLLPEMIQQFLRADPRHVGRLDLLAHLGIDALPI